MTGQSVWQPTAPPTAGDPGSIGSQGTNPQTVGTLFISSADGNVDQIWYYSAPDSVTSAAGITAITSLPTAVALYGTDGTVLYSNTNPVWSGAPASGWVSTDITSTPVVAGTPYIAAVEGDSVENGAGYWNAYSYGYFGAGNPGDTGIINGILTVPGADSANNPSPQGFNHNSAGDGTAGTLQFPQGNYANANWWVDVTVTETVTVQSGTGVVPDGAEDVKGAGTLGTTGPTVTVDGMLSGGTQGVTGLAAFSSNSTGPTGSGDGGTTGGSVGTGFDTVRAVDWFTLLGDLDAHVELQIGPSWQDVSNRVLVPASTDLTIGRGHPDESTTAAASTFSGTLDNHDGTLSYLNPLSPFYGLLGALNTPLRVSVPDASAHLRLEADSTSYANYPAVHGLGSFEIWLDADADNWYQDQTLVSQWDDTINGCSWYLNTLASGALELGISQDGVSGSSRYAVSFPLPRVHGRLSIRVTYDSVTGQVTFYQGKYCRNWQVTAYSGLPAGGPHATTASVELGYATNAAQRGLPGFNGRIYVFALLDTIGGTITDNAKVAADFTTLTPGVTSWGNGWTLQGTAEVTDRNYRFHGESGAWPQSWTPGGDANTRINLSAGGLLRRMGANGTNINSAMYRAYTHVNNAGVEAYWPFEDGQNATQLASAIGGTPFRWYGGNPSVGGFSGFNCSAPIVTFNGAALVGTITPYAPANDAVTRFLLNIPDGGDTSGTLATIYYTGGTVATMNVGYTTGGGLGLSGWDWQERKLFSTGNIGFGADGKLLRVSVELRNTGNSMYSANLVTLSPGGDSAAQFPTNNLNGRVGMVSKIVFNPDRKLKSVSVGHVSVESIWTSLFDLGLTLNAYQGEHAGIRFKRLCEEEGVTFRGIGNIADTAEMGPQGIKSLTGLLQECVDTDKGAWVEPRQILGWGYRTRVSMGNQYAAVAFDYNQDQLSDTLEPTVDDQVIKNDITVSSSDGSSSRRVLDDGSIRSVSKVGRYDTTFSVNAPDSDLDSHASWRLHALTVDEPRYRQIGADLANAALSDLYWDILNADLGDRVTVQNPPVWLPPGLIDQLAQGEAEVIGLKKFTIQWNGIPSTPWNVAYADDVIIGRADTDSSVLSADVSASDTTLSVWTNSGPLWVTDPAEFPFDIRIGGEQVTVTGITGAGYPQTFTVTRAVNGISKPHSSGSDIRLWSPAIISL